MQAPSAFFISVNRAESSHMNTRPVDRGASPVNRTIWTGPKLWKAKFFILRGVIFLVRLQGNSKLIIFGRERIKDRVERGHVELGYAARYIKLLLAPLGSNKPRLSRQSGETMADIYRKRQSTSRQNASESWMNWRHTKQIQPGWTCHCDAIDDMFLIGKSARSLLRRSCNLPCDTAPRRKAEWTVGFVEHGPGPIYYNSGWKPRYLEPPKYTTQV